MDPVWSGGEGLGRTTAPTTPTTDQTMQVSGLRNRRDRKAAQPADHCAATKPAATAQLRTGTPQDRTPVTAPAQQLDTLTRRLTTPRYRPRRRSSPCARGLRTLRP